MWTNEYAGHASAVVVFPGRIIPCKPFISRRLTHNYEEMIRASWIERCGLKWAGFTGIASIDITVMKPISPMDRKSSIGKPNIIGPDVASIANMVITSLENIAFGAASSITSISVHKAPLLSSDMSSKIVIRTYYYNPREERAL